MSVERFYRLLICIQYEFIEVQLKKVRINNLVFSSLYELKYEYDECELEFGFYQFKKRLSHPEQDI